MSFKTNDSAQCNSKHDVRYLQATFQPMQQAVFSQNAQSQAAAPTQQRSPQVEQISISRQTAPTLLHPPPGSIAAQSSLPQMQDSMQQLLRGIVQQLSHHAPVDVHAPAEEVDQLVAAQAAELASARQAMQLMLQLLEQQQETAAQPPAIPQVSTAEHQAEITALRQQLIEQVSHDPMRVTLESGDQSQRLAAQAAELASARQAMQLLAQLLEPGVLEESAAEPVSLAVTAEQQDMHAALASILTDLQGAAASATTAAQPPSQVPEQVRCHLWVAPHQLQVLQQSSGVGT